MIVDATVNAVDKISVFIVAANHYTICLCISRFLIGNLWPTLIACTKFISDSNVRPNELDDSAFAVINFN